MVALEEDYLKKDIMKVIYTDGLEDTDLDNMRGFVKALNAKRAEQEKLRYHYTRPVRNLTGLSTSMAEKDKQKRGSTYEEGVGYLPLHKINCDRISAKQNSQVIKYVVSQKENVHSNEQDKELSLRPCNKERVGRKEDSSTSGERS